MTRSSLIPILVAAPALLVAAAGRADEPAPGLRFTTPPVMVASPGAVRLPQALPMPIVRKDLSLYSIKVAEHNPAYFTIRIVTPTWLAAPGGGSTPPLGQPAPQRRIPLR